jgi:hypothetical protein
MTNLFGDLACCHCGGRMKVHRRGNKGEYVYLGCSARRDGACDNTKFYRLDMVEAKLFALIGNLELPTQPDDKADDLGARLEMEQKEAAKLQRSIDAMAATFGDAPASIRASMAKLVKRHTDKLATVTQLERQLATLKNAKPADQELAAVQSLSARLQRLSRSALVETRGKIAQALPTLLTRLVFKPDGVVAVVNDGRKLKLGEWVAAGGVLYSPRSKQEERARGKVWSSPIRKR